MFGESDSESPRVPSPWDSLASAPSSPTHNGTQGIPKLVPEAEEGNVEYKLQLLSPSPARFARLVTQLKWRLLEGGGQAYYELGVADSGNLVGLPRQQLEESLETLEMMAGEIGASVIVVKEIEVPPELSTLAESQIERWDGRRSTRRKDLLRMTKQDDDESPTTSTTEVETELSNADATDAEETTCYSPVTSPSSPGGKSNPSQVSPRPIPISLPFDPALTIFTMDLGEDVANYADNEAPDDDIPTDGVTEFSVSLEISSVYKPRPMKKRATHITHFEYAKKRSKNGYPPSKSTCHTAGPIAQDNSETAPQANEANSQHRRDKQDKRRELKLNTLLTRVPTRRSPEPPSDFVDHLSIRPFPNDDPPPESSLTIVVDPLTTDASETITIASKEPRLIVEALVVRKLSLDEAFLDFEGFSLQ